MKKTIVFYFTIILAIAFNPVSAQKKDITLSQQDARFDVSAKRYFSTLGGSEEYWYYVQNNTSDEYEMTISVTIDLACVGTKTFLLGINKVVHLNPNGKFDAFKDDWVHIYNSGADNFKNCRLKDGDGYTLYKGLRYTISNVVNITQKKAAEAKKKEDEKLRAEAEKKKKEQESQAKADADKKKKEADAKVAADKKKNDDAIKAKEAEKAKTTNAKKQSATSTQNSSSSTASKSKSTASSNSTKADEAERKTASKQKEENDKQAALAKEAARKREEQDLLNKKQADYDKRKSDAQNAQTASDAASGAAFAAIAFILGEWIYNEDMGEYDPAFSFKRNKKSLQFGLGIDFGYSMSVFPMLFESKISTMSGGVSSNKNEIQGKTPFIINFDPMVRMGAENNNFGGFGYAGAKLGTSPLFDASQLSFNYGARLYAGAKWVKAYADYSSGSRAISKSSGSDVEENGSGEANHSFSRLEYGVRFTTHPKDDLRRSHIYLGVISEKLSFEKPNNYVDPESGTLKTLMESPTITGYTFQWNKEHTFKLFANIYPEFIYSGNINAGSGTLSSEFKSTKTDTFFELGFVRSINFW